MTRNFGLAALATVALFAIIFAATIALREPSRPPTPVSVSAAASYLNPWRPANPAAASFGLRYQVLDPKHQPENPAEVFWLGTSFRSSFPYLQPKAKQVATVAYASRESVEETAIIIESFPNGNSGLLRAAKNSQRHPIARGFFVVSASDKGAFSAFLDHAAVVQVQVLRPREPSLAYLQSVAKALRRMAPYQSSVPRGNGQAVLPTGTAKERAAASEKFKQGKGRPTTVKSCTKAAPGSKPVCVELKGTLHAPGLPPETTKP